MGNPSGLIDFFNSISLAGLEDLAQIKPEDISSKLTLLEEMFQKDIEELKQLAASNTSRTDLLCSTDDAEFIVRALVDESLLETGNKFITHWIAKMRLSQKSIVMLVSYLIRKIGHYKANWDEYNRSFQVDAINNKHSFLQVLKTYTMVYGLCQNIGLAISDYSRLYGKLQSNIGMEEMDRPLIVDPEIKVSERLSDLATETENCLLINPEKSILGFAGVRIELESYIAIKLQDKMRQYIRSKDGNNKRDLKYVSGLSRKDIFEMTKEVLCDGKAHAALDMIYEATSRRLHRAIQTENYVSWGSWMFMLDTLEKKINDLNPQDPRLERIMKQLEKEGKLCIVPTRLYV